MLPPHVQAILAAQWRTLRNFYPRHRGGVIFSGAISLIWYCLWATASFAIAALLSEWTQAVRLPQVMTGGLLVVFLYWQVTPLLLATTGASLDLKRLLVYPIPRGQLFAIEVMLRLSISFEVILLMCGATVGLLRNHAIPLWAPLAFLPFTFFNLFLSAGLRDLLTRLLARKRIREIVVFLLVMLAAVPQYLAMRGAPKQIKAFAAQQSILLPWAAAGEIAGGKISLAAVCVLLGWTALAWMFGRWQFNRGLRFDADAARAADRPATQAGSFTDRLFRLPGKLFSDPLAAMIEKDLRFLSRAPRFRLVFLMGFSFGIMIWLPLVFGRRNVQALLSENLLTLVSVYALLLLGDVLIWNYFAYDRSATQIYHLAPVRFFQVIVAKNITTVILIMLELTMVTLVCLLLRVPLTGGKILESFSVTLILLLYLISFGNLSATKYPRPMDPSQSWRSSARGFQMLLILIYPIAALPLALPYLARYAFNSNIAFYCVLPINLALGVVLYWVSMDSALASLQQRKEAMLSALAPGEGPMALNM